MRTPSRSCSPTSKKSNAYAFTQSPSGHPLSVSFVLCLPVPLSFAFALRFSPERLLAA
jgi:hypothetical protein